MSSGKSGPEIHRRIGMGSSTMAALDNVWKQSRLSQSTKLHVYRSCVLSVVLYGSETWTVLEADLRRLEAFHMRCQRRILGIRWNDFVRNADITILTGLPSLQHIMSSRRNSMFGHIARMKEDVPANRILDVAIDVISAIPPAPDWKRRSRPSKRWLYKMSRGMTQARGRHGTMRNNEVIVEWSRRNGPRRLRVPDDDDDEIVTKNMHELQYKQFFLLSACAR